MALAKLGQDAASVALLLEGLQQHYLHALASGRIDVWKKVAHGIIDLVGDEAEITARENMN